ncbi:MAG: dihydrodipicolinate reductase [Chloroflexi bacterium]|nr:dihydrodipicolinate reductase [Chloroflexota bacterium]
MFRVIHYGVGALGVQIVRAAARRQGLQIVGAVDTDPAKAGRDLGQVAEVGRELGVIVAPDASGLGSLQADVALHTTRSFLLSVREQLLGIIAAGKHVISTCEELAFPAAQRPEIAREIHEAALAAGVTVLGTGINPGYLMDYLPITLSAMCQEVHSVSVVRVADASQRRLPLQRKIGAGMTPEEFRAKAVGGAMGHIGLAESVALIATALGWKLERTVTTLEPEIAGEDVTTRYLEVRAGQVTGIHQVARGIVDGQTRIILDLSMHVAVREAQDTVIIDGVPSVRSTIPGGINGDVATVGIVLNAIPRVVSAPPGLLAMKDLPPPSFWT